MNDLTQDLRDYRAYLESELAIMAKATAGPWQTTTKDTFDRDYEQPIRVMNENTAIATHCGSATFLRPQDATAIAASGNGYEPSLRAQLRMLDALEAIFQAASSTAGLVSIITLHKCSEATTVALLDIIAAWKGGKL